MYGSSFQKSLFLNLSKLRATVKNWPRAAATGTRALVPYFFVEACF